LLLIVLFVVSLIVALLLTVLFCVTLPPRAAAVVPVGASIIKPTHCPSTFTKTSKLSFAATCLPVKLKIVSLVVALPVVALPALVLLLTLALPEAAVLFRYWQY
jgi:hypothetical protein